MRTCLLATAMLACALASSACSTTTTQQVLTNLNGCTRSYNGSVGVGVLGGGQFTGTVKIDCAPSAGSTTPAEAVKAPGA